MRYRRFRLEAATQVTGTGVYDYDFATGTSYWSPELKAMAGLPPDSGEFRLKQMARIIHPEDRERYVQAVEAALDSRGDGHFEGEYPIMRPDGALRWAKVRGQTFFAGEGSERRVLGASGIVIDITEHKRTEKALRESEERYRTLFDNMSEGFMLGEPILDSAGHAVDHRYLAVNEAFHVQTGIPRGIEGRRMRECFPQIEQFWIDRYASVARTGQPDRFEDYNVDTQRHYDVYAFSPSPGRFAVLFRDITERKRTEQALKDSGRRLALALEASVSSVFDADMVAGIVRADDRHFTMLGYVPGEVTALADWWNMMHPDDREVASKQFDEVIQGTRDFYRQEVRVRAKDGSWRWILSQLTIAERDAEGRALRLVGTHTDIAKRKEAEAAIEGLNRTLQQRATELEAANRELESFSYSVSHDLRAPLRSIDGFSRLLLETYADRLDEQGREYLGRVCSSSQRMAQLIDDLLTLARLSRAEVHREAVDLSALAQAVAGDLQAHEPQRDVRFSIQDGISAVGDAGLLRVVLENLLGNAWKYTSHHPGAHIEFGTEQRDDGKTVYFIRDDGAGFDMAYAGKLFDAFQRLHTQTQFSGTGVGLTTVQRIIRRHGGEVWAESAVESGATFRFTLGE